MMSEQSQQLSGSIFNEPTELQVFGMHFCQTCKNLMKPFHANGYLLEFLCERCNQKNPVDFSRKSGEQCLLYSKQLQVGSRKYVADLAYIFDPTMPNVEVTCPECDYNRAVYFLTPDEGETKLVAVMICASASGTTAKCGYSWILEETSDLFPNRIQTEDERLFQNQF